MTQHKVVADDSLSAMDEISRVLGKDAVKKKKKKINGKIEILGSNNIEDIASSNAKKINKRKNNFSHLFSNHNLENDTKNIIEYVKNTQTKNLVSFPKIKTKEDYVLWLKLSKAKIKFKGMKYTLTKWRKTNNSLSSGTYQKLVDGFRVYFIYQQFNFIKLPDFVEKFSTTDEVFSVAGTNVIRVPYKRIVLI